MYLGGSAQPPPRCTPPCRQTQGSYPNPPLDADPWRQTPFDAYPEKQNPWRQTTPPPRRQTPTGCRHPTPVNRMTHRCKNITLSQISFCGRQQQCCFASVKTFDANIDIIGNFVLIVKNWNKLDPYHQTWHVFKLAFVPAPLDFITVRNEVAKVMFLQVSVCQQGGLLPGGCLLRGGVPGPGGPGLGGAWSGGAWSWGVPGHGGCLLLGASVAAPGGGIPACTEAEPPGRDGYCCGRYASHWNAFLLTYMIQLELIEHDFTRTLKSQIYNECPT